MKKKRLLPLGILAVLVLAALIYTRPMTLAGDRAGLDIAQCESGIHRLPHGRALDEPESAAWRAFRR